MTPGVAYVVVLLGLAGVPGPHRREVARAVVEARRAAAREFGSRHVPAPELVAAIIRHESAGRVRACHEDVDGGSSRGLMQLERPASRCTAEDDARFARDYDPAGNVRAGVRLLALQSRWHARHHHRDHDPLVHYAGRGPAARRAAREFRRIARELAALARRWKPAS